MVLKKYELLEVTKEKLYTPVVGDILDQMGLYHQFFPQAVQPLRDDVKLAGYAMTVLMIDVFGQQKKPFGYLTEALDDLQEGEIYVAAGGTMRCAYQGEFLTATAKKREAAGVAVNGWHRDVPQVLDQNWPVFPRGYYAQDSSVRTQVADYRRRAEIEGVTVMSGDLIFGDVDGVLITPAEHIEYAIEETPEKVRGEKNVRKAIEKDVNVAEAFAIFGILQYLSFWNNVFQTSYEEGCMVEYRIYAETYAGADENGIFRYRMDGNSQMLERGLALPGISNPSYLALSQSGTMTYAVMEDVEYHGKAGGGAHAIECRESSLGILSSRGTTGTLPCHVTLDEEAGIIYATNYMGGSLSVFPPMPDGSLGEMNGYRQHKGKGPNTLCQEGPHVHFSGLSPEKDGIWCVDPGLDCILFYGIDVYTMTPSHRPERDIMLPKGTGPRHLVFQPGNAHRIYVVCELSSEVFAANILKKGCQILQRISSLSAPNDKSSCVAVKCSEDGRFLYVSNRGDDSTVVFRTDPKNGLLHPVQTEEVGGRTPRDILVLEDMILSANQDGNIITCFYRNEDTEILAWRVGETFRHAPVYLTAVPTA